MTGGQTQFAEELRQSKGLRRVKTQDLPCAGLAVRSMLQAAKFLYSSKSSARPDEGEKACESDSLELCPLWSALILCIPMIGVSASLACSCKSLMRIGLQIKPAAARMQLLVC